MRKVRYFIPVISFLFVLGLSLNIPENANAQWLDIFKSKKEEQVKTQQEDCDPAEAEESAAVAIVSESDQDTASEPVQTEEEKAQTAEEEQDLMEKALELLASADECWVRGDIENTLNTLDKAYALILDTNGDPAVARQKDDLRLLISRKIMTVYSAQQTRTNGKASEIPLKLNADVEKEIRSFQGPEREFFLSSYKRSTMFRETIIEELRNAGMPEELVWLPLVESGFKVGALSRARALGLWQFIPSTGYKFGLTRDEWMDERMDVIKSTRAAIAYLKELHGMFGDWLTVLAGYNCGEGRVLRVISRQHINYFDRFWDLYSQLPNETARYVPRFLATLHIVKNPAKYGFDLQDSAEPTFNYEIVTVDRMLKLQDVAAKLEVSEEMMNILNAELRYKITPNRPYELKIPNGMAEQFQLVEADIPAAEKPKFASSASYIRHRVKNGETVSIIARRYRVSTAAIIRINKLSRNARIVTGQVIRIPVSYKSSAVRRVYSGNEKYYTIQRGDTLLGIARRFNVPVDTLKKINNLKSNQIRAGQVLKLSKLTTLKKENAA